MKIIIVPDSFKGSLSAGQAADSMERGIRRVFPHAEIVKFPVADGGEGTVEVLSHCIGGQLCQTTVKVIKSFSTGV